jgi:hypothetical protein
MRVNERLQSINWREVRGGSARWERDLRANLRRLPEERTALLPERIQRASANETLQCAEWELGASCNIF